MPYIAIHVYYIVSTFATHTHIHAHTHTYIHICTNNEQSFQVFFACTCQLSCVENYDATTVGDTEQLPPGWEDGGKIYYIDYNIQTTSWINIYNNNFFSLGQYIALIDIV